MNIYSSEKALPYVYICTHKITGEFYIGSRTSKNIKLPPHLDLPKYKTSSKRVKPRFNEFDWIILAEFFTSDAAYEFEQETIFTFIHDALCLNTSCYHSKQKFKTTKESMESSKKSLLESHGVENPGQTALSRKLASDRMSSDKNPAYNQSEETRNKISNTTKENNEKMSPEERSLKYGNSGEDNPMFGKSCTYKMTQEEILAWKSNISDTWKRDPKIWMHNLFNKNVRIPVRLLNEAIEQGFGIGYAKGTHPNSRRAR